MSGGRGLSSQQADDVALTVGITGDDDALCGLILHRLARSDSFRSCIADRDALDDYCALLLAQSSSAGMCTELKQLRRAGYTGPILCAGRANDLEMMALAIASGADDYLPIPERLDEIPLRVAALIRHQSRTMRRASATTALQAEPEASDGNAGDYHPLPLPRQELVRCVLDTNQRTLTCDGLTTKLTSSEMQIVDYLRVRAHSWVTATSLMQHVFGYGGDADNTLIRVHVCSLRKKLGAHAGVLESRRTLGYRWRA